MREAKTNIVILLSILFSIIPLFCYPILYVGVVEFVVDVSPMSYEKIPSQIVLLKEKGQDTDEVPILRSKGKFEKEDIVYLDENKKGLVYFQRNNDWFLAKMSSKMIPKNFRLLVFCISVSLISIIILIFALRRKRKVLQNKG